MPEVGEQRGQFFFLRASLLYSCSHAQLTHATITQNSEKQRSFQVESKLQKNQDSCRMLLAWSLVKVSWQNWQSDKPHCSGHRVGRSQLLLSFIAFLRIPAGPSWQFLSWNGFEAGITTQNLVHEVVYASLVAFDLTLLPMVEGREAQALVGVEHDC